MQLLAYYARLVSSVIARQAYAARQTCLPTLGIEVIGNMFRWVAHHWACHVWLCGCRGPRLHNCGMHGAEL